MVWLLNLTRMRVCCGGSLDIQCIYIYGGIMHAKIQRWGNSAAVRLPASILKAMDLGSGDTLEIGVEEGALILTPVKARPRYQLSELLAQCDLNAPQDDELVAWNSSKPVGNEAW